MKSSRAAPQHLLLLCVLLLAACTPPTGARRLSQAEDSRSAGDQIVDGLQTVGEGVACFFTFGLLDLCQDEEAATPPPTQEESAPAAPAPAAPAPAAPAPAQCASGRFVCCSVLYLAANPSDPCCSASACDSPASAPAPAPTPAPAPAPEPAAAVAVVLPADGSAELFGSGASATGAEATASDDSGGGAPIGAIIGGVLGGLAALALALGLFLLYRRRQNKKYADHSVNKFISEKAAALPGSTPGAGLGPDSAKPSPAGALPAAVAGAALISASSGEAAAVKTPQTLTPQGAADDSPLGPLGSGIMAVELTAASPGSGALGKAPVTAPVALGPLGAAFMRADMDSARGRSIQSTSRSSSRLSNELVTDDADEGLAGLTVPTAASALATVDVGTGTPAEVQLESTQVGAADAVLTSAAGGLAASPFSGSPAGASQNSGRQTGADPAAERAEESAPIARTSTMDTGVQTDDLGLLEGGLSGSRGRLSGASSLGGRETPSMRRVGGGYLPPRP